MFCHSETVGSLQPGPRTEQGSFPLVEETDGPLHVSDDDPVLHQLLVAEDPVIKAEWLDASLLYACYNLA